MPIPSPWWKMYVDDVIIIVKKTQVDPFFNHMNSVDPHINLPSNPLTQMAACHSWTPSVSPTKITPSELQSTENQPTVTAI